MKKVKAIKCRFCGLKAGLEKSGSGMLSEFRVFCNTRNACGIKGPWRQTERGAITAWNLMMEVKK